MKESEAVDSTFSELSLPSLLHLSALTISRLSGTDSVLDMILAQSPSLAKTLETQSMQLGFQVDQITATQLNEGIIPSFSKHVQTENLFSSNEILEDVPTHSIKYLIVAHLAGRAAAIAERTSGSSHGNCSTNNHGNGTTNNHNNSSHSNNSSSSNSRNNNDAGDLMVQMLETQLRRRTMLEQSIRFHKDYLECLSRWYIISSKELDDLERPPPKDPASVRMMRIERHKQEKQLSDELNQYRKRLWKSCSSEVQPKGLFQEEGDALTGDHEEQEEEEVRDAMTLCLRLAAHLSVDMVRSAESELDMIRFSLSRYSKGVDPGAEARAAAANIRVREQIARQQRANTAVGAPTASTATTLPPNYMIIDRKTQIKGSLFKNAHTLPTYTVEEWGAIETKMLAQRAQQEQERAAQMEMIQAKKSEEQKEDEEMYEKRRWDDWRDDHNRGSGNTTDQI